MKTTSATSKRKGERRGDMAHGDLYRCPDKMQDQGDGGIGCFTKAEHPRWVSLVFLLVCLSELPSLVTPLKSSSSKYSPTSIPSSSASSSSSSSSTFHGKFHIFYIICVDVVACYYIFVCHLFEFVKRADKGKVKAYKIILSFLYIFVPFGTRKRLFSIDSLVISFFELDFLLLLTVLCSFSSQIYYCKRCSCLL